MVLALAPISDGRIYMFLVCKQEGCAPLNLYVEDEFDRASRGGTGGIKSITNYAPVRD